MGNSYKKAKVQTFSNALQVIRENYRIQKSIELDLVVMDKSCEKFALNVILNLLKNDSKSSSQRILSCYTYKTTDTHKYKDCVVSRSAIIFIGKIKNFYDAKMSRNLNTHTYEEIHFYIVSEDYGREFYVDSLRKIFRNEPPFNLFSHLGLNSTLLTSFNKRNSQNLLLFTFDYLSGPLCSHKMKLSNEFSSKDQKWKNYQFGPSRFNQFHGCFLSLHGAEPFSDFEVEAEPYYNFLLEIIAKKLNFSLS